MKSIIVAATILLLGAGTLFAQPGPHSAAWKKMNLTAEQKTALKDIRSNSQKQMIDIRAALQKKRIDMKDMVQGESSDRVAFERLSREIADLQVRQKLVMFDADQNVMKQLNADQQKLWKEIKAQRMSKGMERMRGMRDRMRGPEKGMRGSEDEMNGHREMMRERMHPAPPPEDD
ncbi:MAG: periplasmic heavy metal sensor [Bacteroidetes bacterium]|nr:periplasmic heavy metal sensor [Bacteroidota bacterium]